MAPPLPFPDDLIRVQLAWTRTYEALAAHSGDAAVLRRRLIHLSSRIACHPFLATGPGRSPAVRVELRRAARAHAQRREAGAR
ncbi:hypothetical protein ACIOEX_11140 [Streptomyces sp. NPDC087850]|uniref:hypothetical protein n=1 Tax=Streptomyces sp. NPDC087850 TaxID=3365809 RepID=UPI0038185B88